MRQDARVRKPVLSDAMESIQNRRLVAIVDDEVFVRRAIGRLVSSWGIDTATFTSGREFIDLVEETPAFNPDCVILDIEMPIVNGLLVQKQLRSRRPNIPVIVVTATDDPRIREEALALGAAAVFRKPV